MSHPSLVELSMLADGALPSEAAAALNTHVSGCAQCTEQLSAMRMESQYLTTAMRMEVADTPPMPSFSRPASLRNFALANVATGLVIWIAQFLWKTIFGEMVINAASWFTSIYLPDIYAMSSATVLYLLAEGTAMFDAYLGLIVVTVVAVSTLALWFRRLRGQSTANLCIGLMMMGVLVAPAPANALQVMRDDDTVVIPASEVINDTLIIAAESIVVEGDINGSLIAVGQSIDISGRVAGNIVTFGETIKVRSAVAGALLGASSSFTATGADIAGDLWFAGETLTLDDETAVAQNATLAGETITVEGSIARDLYAFSETVELNGVVGEDLEAFAARIRLLGEAQVAGNVRIRTRDEDRLYRADTAQVGGEVEFLRMPEEFENRSRFVQAQFYLWQTAQLIGAFLVGWALLSLVPPLSRLSIGAGVEGLKSGGIGLLALISSPIVAVIFAITLIGIPLALITFGIWMLGIYLAHIAIGSILGRMIMPQSDSTPLTLLVGLLVIAIVVNIPIVGGIIGFILTILGLGILIEYLYGIVNARATPAA